jgi:hypothetical protein
MNDENSGASGNRWEPADRPDHPADQPTDVSAGASLRRTWLTRARTAVAGGAAAVLLAGGLGGFAIGRATAGSDGRGGADQQPGVPTGFDRDGDGRGPGGPTLGQLPDSQVPGGPGADDQDGSQDSSGDDDGNSSNT